MTRRIAPEAAGVPALEPIAQDLYDTKLYPSLGTGILTFFQNPAVGSERETNMVSSGTLSYPKQFHAFGIAVEIFPAYLDTADIGVTEVFAQDKKKLREHAYLTLVIGSKDYLTLPLTRIPEGVGMTGAIAGGATNSYAITHGVPDIKHAFELTVPQQGKIKPIHIPAQQSFRVDIRWPNILVLNGAHDNGIKVRVYLVGVLWREVQ